jgi:hypothetical protein
MRRTVNIQKITEVRIVMVVSPDRVHDRKGRTVGREGSSG